MIRLYHKASFCFTLAVWIVSAGMNYLSYTSEIEKSQQYTNSRFIKPEIRRQWREYEKEVESRMLSFGLVVPFSADEFIETNEPPVELETLGEIVQDLKIH